VTPSQAKLDAAELELLKQWRTLVQAHRENRRWAPHYRVIWRQVRDVRATAIRAIRTQRKAIQDAAAITSGPKKKACE
jgi:hypothetical protein